MRVSVICYQSLAMLAPSVVLAMALRVNMRKRFGLEGLNEYFSAHHG